MKNSSEEVEPARPKFTLGFHTYDDPVLERMKATTLAFIKAVHDDAKPYWLVFTGNSGTGKTHLLRKIKGWWNLSGHWATHPDTGANITRIGRLFDWRDVVDGMKQGNWDLLEAMTECHLLLLDDIGSAEDKSGLGLGKLDHVLNRRLGEWTVLATNLTMSQIDASERRIASRMARGNSVIVDCNTIDFNLRGTDAGI